MKKFAVDLHIHSTLSPCGSSEMTPINIFSRAKKLGYDALVISDHNSMLNQTAFLTKANEYSIRCLPGMEVQTKEDIHILCIFDSIDQGDKWQGIVDENLPKVNNNQSVFGEQVVVNAIGEKIQEVEHLLLTATTLSVDEVVMNVNDLGGICIAAHIDRQAFSLWGHLGFIPKDLGIAAVELTPHLPRQSEQLASIKESGFGIVISSDAHWLDQMIEPRTFFYIEEFTIEEIKLALRNEAGRKVEIVR